MTPARTLSPDEQAEWRSDSADGSYFELDRWPVGSLILTHQAGQWWAFRHVPM